MPNTMFNMCIITGKIKYSYNELQYKSRKQNNNIIIQINYYVQIILIYYIINFICVFYLNLNSILAILY